MKATVKTLVFAALVAGMVHADQINLVAGTWTPLPPGFSAHNTNAYMRDLTLVPAPVTNASGVFLSGFRLYGVNTPNSVSYPPTTNGAAYYVDLAAGELQNAYSLVSWVGWKNGVSGSGSGGAGKFLFAIGGATGRKGYCHMFSSTTATSAAYYASSRLENLLGSAAPKSIGADMVATNVNPAYVIPFTVLPTNLPASAKISGTVASGSGNNVLPASILTVEYQSNGASAWTSVTVNNDGTFETGDLTGGDYSVRARVVDAETPRPGLPLSQEIPVKIIPEPAALFALMGGLLVFLRKK